MYAQDSVSPIISWLRPRSLGELLDQAFRLYRKHFLTFLAVIAVVYIPVNLGVELIDVFLTGRTISLDSDSFVPSTRNNEFLINQFLTLATSAMLGLFATWLQYLGHAALTASINNSYMDRPVSFAHGYREMWRRIGPISGAIGLQLLLAVALFTPLFLIFLLATLSIDGGSSPSGGFGGLICLSLLALIPAAVFATYIYVKWSLVVPAIMIENCGPREGLRRSAQLVQGSWWRTVGLILLLSLLGAVIAGGPAAVVSILLALFFQNLEISTFLLLISVSAVLITTLVIPLNLATTTLYYFDLRVRKEGYDLETAINKRYGPRTEETRDTTLGWETGKDHFSGKSKGGMTSLTPPTLGQAEPSSYVNTAEETTEADSPEGNRLESADPSQKTSPTPDWLAPPVLGGSPPDENALDPSDPPTEVREKGPSAS